jgi:hypothetical protein
MCVLQSHYDLLQIICYISIFVISYLRYFLKHFYHIILQVSDGEPYNTESYSQQSNGVECLKNHKFEALKDHVIKTRKGIWEYWDVDKYPLFLAAIHIPKKSWNMQKQKFVNLLLQGKKSIILTDLFCFEKLTPVHN